MTAENNGGADLRRLGRFAADYHFGERDSLLREVVRGCVLYGLAVGVASLQVPVVRSIVSAIDQDTGGSGGPARRFYDDRTASVSNAAMANAVLMSARAQGDSHPVGHIGGVVVPTSLAIAEAQGLSGADFLESVTVGYEIALRIGRDHSAALSRRGFRTTPCYGVFGAAASTARALGLDGDGVANALALAANLAGGLREYVNAGTGESPFQAGFGARAGVLAALLANDGVEAAESALHGPAGFFAAYGEGGDTYAARLVEGLGQEFELSTVTYKPYPACQFLRGTIQVLLELREKVDAAPVAGMEVRLNPFEANFVGMQYVGPFKSAAQTVMSGPFCAALAWATGAVTYTGMRRFDNEDVLSLVPRVAIVADPAVQRYQTHVELRLEDGRVFGGGDEGGAASYEMSWDAAVRQAPPLCDEAGLPSEIGRRLVAAVAEIDRARSVENLLDAVREAVASSTLASVGGGTR